MSEIWMPPASAWQWQLTDFVVLYIMWGVMMAAMMLPSAIHMIHVFGKTCQQRYGQDNPYSYLFSSAYLLVWLGFSLFLTLLQWQLHNLHWLSKMMENTNTPFAAGLFILAGIYQFTSIKNICLKYCQSPFGFLLNFWQPGKTGAFAMGIRHGITCLGCCWAQMLIMFAIGVMNISGMVLITLIILLEKGLPQQYYSISQITGALLCLFGAGQLFLYTLFYIS